MSGVRYNDYMVFLRELYKGYCDKSIKVTPMQAIDTIQRIRDDIIEDRGLNMREYAEIDSYACDLLIKFDAELEMYN